MAEEPQIKYSRKAMLTAIEMSNGAAESMRTLTRSTFARYMLALGAAYLIPAICFALQSSMRVAVITPASAFLTFQHTFPYYGFIGILGGLSFLSCMQMTRILKVNSIVATLISLIAAFLVAYADRAIDYYSLARVNPQYVSHLLFYDLPAVGGIPGLVGGIGALFVFIVLASSKKEKLD
jgi:hypothetical protein